MIQILDHNVILVIWINLYKNKVQVNVFFNSHSEISFYKCNIWNEEFLEKVSGEIDTNFIFSVGLNVCFNRFIKSNDFNFCSSRLNIRGVLQHHSSNIGDHRSTYLKRERERNLLPQCAVLFIVSKMKYFSGHLF